VSDYILDLDSVPEDHRRRYLVKESGYPTDRMLHDMDDRQLLTHMGVPQKFQVHAMQMTYGSAGKQIADWLDLLPYIFRPQYDKQEERPSLLGMGLVLHGPSGTRKTTTAAAVLLAAVRRNIPNADPSGNSRWYGAAMGRFVSWQEVSDLFRKAISDEDAAVSLDPIRKAMAPAGPMEERGDFLVVDDISRERATEYNVGRLAQVLRHRHEWGYPTILTTNHNPKDWNTVYGDVMGTFMSRAFITVKMER
jgi:hypothetical protein